MINLPKLILASGSPRRSEILTSVGWTFEKQSADVDESVLPGETPEEYVCRLAREKAEAVAKLHETALVLGADTTVVIDNEIIGKPVDLDDARQMLRKLSGNRHEVLTGVALAKISEGNLETRVAYERTGVKFSELTDAEIEFLVAKGEPLDKAGAYAVQAQAALFIEGIEGDYWNVVGLPVNLVYSLMQKDDVFIKNTSSFSGSI
jgi:septum formation protein